MTDVFTQQVVALMHDFISAPLVW